MEMYLLMHDVENKNIFFTMILGLEKMESDAFFNYLIQGASYVLVRNFKWVWHRNGSRHTHNIFHSFLLRSLTAFLKLVSFINNEF